MIISEKQVMQLIQYAECYVDLMFDLQGGRHTPVTFSILKYLKDIEEQQSEELKEIK